MLNVSRNVLIAGIAAVVSIVAIAVLAWRAAQVTAPLPPQRPVASAPESSAVPAPQVAGVPASQPAQSANQSVQGAPAAPAGATGPAPTFDVVRVEPSGETVVAGRAAPGSIVNLLASGKPVGKATADANGQFVIIPDALRPGAHDLSLTQTGKEGEQASAQSVAVAVPENAKSKEVVVALAEPGKPTQILSDGKPAAPAAAAPPVSFRTVEAEQGSGFFAAGQATPGSKLRIYMNDTHVAEVTADEKGQWSLRVARGMAAGNYAVRIDQIDPAGKVVARAEVPFAYTPQMAATAPANAAPPQSAAPEIAGRAAVPTPTAPVVKTPETASATPSASTAPAAAPPASAPHSAGAHPVIPSQTAGRDPANATIDSIATASVVRGDSLWRISRKMLGQGVRYTQIYDANTAQIRDPRRIYPGQVLVVPMGNHPAKATP